MPTPVFAPDGTVRQIPDDQLQAALGAGGQRAVRMTDPQGTARWIPEDRTQDALNAGGKLYSDQSDTRSLFQKAKDNFNAATQGAKPGEGAVQSFIENVGAGGGDVIRSIGHTVLHPLDTAVAEQQAEDAKPYMQRMREAATNAVLGPAGNMAIDTVKGLVTQPGRTIGQLGTGTILGEAAAPVLGAAIKGVVAAPEAYGAAKSRLIGGSKLDEVITGDTVTPRQRYNIAKEQGVNLDTAQATNAPVAVQAKRITEHSLGGASKFEANQAANVEALQAHSEKLLNDASPVEMSREDFGNTVKQKLVQDQQKLNDTSGAIYKKLDADVGASTPDTTAIREAAQKIVADNKGYFQNHPEFLSGAPGRAWNIVNSLAETAKAGAADSWSNLHKLRSDLMNMYRSPDIVGSNAEGWLKQLTGKVDESMTGAASGLSPAGIEDFREANDIYKYMKSTYDDPTSRLYHVVRAPDGLTAANTLANITPDVARKIGAAAPELVPQLQRQAMSRLLNPAGNDLPDLGNLSARFTRAQKEQLAGVLTPEQIKGLEDLGRTAKLVKFDSNPSGSGKVAQKSMEAGAIGAGLMRSVSGLAAGSPAAVVEGVAPLAYTGAQRLAAGRLTSPEFTESIMSSRMIKPRPGESMVDYLARKKAAKP